MLIVQVKNWIPRIVVLALVGGAIAFLIVKKPWAKAEEPITFSTVQVTKGSIAAQVTANGTLSAVTTVQVGAQVSGRVVELHADFNDKVKKGQIIAKLDEAVLKSQIDQVTATPTANSSGTSPVSFNGGTVQAMAPGNIVLAQTSVSAQMTDFSMSVTPSNQSIQVAGDTAFYTVQSPPWRRDRPGSPSGE